jgi:hypothetical protein
VLVFIVKNWYGGKYETVCGSATYNFEMDIPCWFWILLKSCSCNIGTVFTFTLVIGRVARLGW